MRDPTASERQLLKHISDQGGSICPGVEIAGRFSREGRKSLRWLRDNGFLTEDTFDDGPRFTLTAQGQEEADA